MPRSRAEYLIDRLLSNQLSRAELDEFLASMEQGDALADYSSVLEQYFDRLMEQSGFHDGQDLSAPPAVEIRQPEEGDGLNLFRKQNFDFLGLVGLFTQLHHLLSGPVPRRFQGLGRHLPDTSNLLLPNTYAYRMQFG